MDTERPGLLSSWDLLALAGLLALKGFYHWILPQLPDPVPTHFNAVGIANGWTPKDQLSWVIFGAPALIWFIIFLVCSGLAVFQQDPVKARLMAAFPLRGFASLGVSILMASGMAIPLWGIPSLQIGIGIMLLMMLTGVVLLSVQAQRLLADAPDAPHYRWGVFYVNPQDDRLWVPKRIGTGLTLNFAKPSAKWVMLLIMAPILAVLGVLMYFKH